MNLLTAKDVAARLGVSALTVIRLADARVRCQPSK